VTLGPGVAVAFAGRWLSALGCEWTSVLQPSDVGFTGARAHYLEMGQPQLSLDLSMEADRARLAQALDDADLVLDGAGPGVLRDLALAPWTTPTKWPALASVSITPYGVDGPDALAPANPLVLAASSGMLWHVGRPDRPPLSQAGEQVPYLAGLHVFSAAVCALYASQHGPPVHYELSEQACGAAVVGHHTGRVSQVAEHLPRMSLRSLWRVYATSDGWAAIAALQRNYPRLAEVMDLPELAEVSPFLDHNKRPEEEARVTRLLAGWFAARTTREVTALAQQHSVPLAPVLSIAEVAESDQLAHREFFTTVLDPEESEVLLPRQLWRSNGHGWRTRSKTKASSHAVDGRSQAPARPPTRPTPAGTRERPGSLPLDGVRVLDLGQIWAGPYAAMLLADQGADVIKVESPSAWDPNRCAAPPPRDRATDWWNTGAYFQEYSRNKRSLGIDIRTPRGHELLGRLVARSDIVIENLRADALDRLGIGYEWMRAQRDDVILVSMAAYGKTGPEARLPGYGPLIEALSGLASVTGWGDGEPQLTTGFAYGDPVAAAAAAGAAMTALLQRDRSGRGQHVDLAGRDVATALMGEALAAWSTSGELPQAQGNGHARAAPHGVFPCRGDDDWIAIAVTQPQEWQGLIALLAAEDWAADPSLADEPTRHARRSELEERVASFTLEHSKGEVLARCRRHGVPAGLVYKPFELLEDPQLQARGFYETPSHPAMGAWQMHGWEWQPRGAGPCVRSPAPDFGAHNHAILRELGLDATQTSSLESQGVITDRPVGIPRLPWERD